MTSLCIVSDSQDRRHDAFTPKSGGHEGVSLLELASLIRCQATLKRRVWRRRVASRPRQHHAEHAEAKNDGDLGPPRLERSEWRSCQYFQSASRQRTAQARYSNLEP